MLYTKYEMLYTVYMSFANPLQNIKQLGLSAGSHVADIGSGTGGYTFEAAKIVGAEGEVYAIDVQKDLLDKLAVEAEHRGLQNIQVLWGDAENIGGTKLRENAVGFVIASNVLFQTDSKSGFVHEIKRILQPNGKVLLIDWSESFGGIGPASHHVVDESVARELFENNGFALEKTFDAGAHHYGLVFRYVVE